MRAWVVHADVSTSSSLGASGCLKVFFPNTTRDMLSVTAGSIIFLCTELCLGPAVVCVSWGQREKEKERLQLGEAQCGKQALRRCWKNVFFFFFFALRAMGTFWGHAHLWSSMSEMPGANVWGLCGVSVSEKERDEERKRNFICGPRGRGGDCTNQKVSFTWQIWANTSSGDLSASICGGRQDTEWDSLQPLAHRSLRWRFRPVYSGI